MDIIRGRRLSAETVRVMQQNIAQAGRLRLAGYGRSAGGRLGTSVTVFEQMMRDSNIALLRCKNTVPVFSLVELDEGQIGNYLGWVDCARVQRPGSSRLGITLMPAKPDRVIPVQIQGIGLCRYFWAIDDDLEAGDRLIGLKHDFLAHKCCGGPLLVLAVAEHIVEWTDYNYALVQITRKRLDNIRAVDCYTVPLCNGNFEVIVVGEGLAVVEEQPGVVRIS